MDKQKIVETLLVWNFWEKDIDVGILRDQYVDKINRYLKTDEVIIVSGVRRSGKSTILLQVLNMLIQNGVPRGNTLYINFEDPTFYHFLDVDLLDKIWDAYVSYLKPQGLVYLVLDEVQKIQGWEHWVRAKYDQKAPVRIFVTGSNAELLSGEFSSVLTGRHFEVSVMPLVFREFLKFRQVTVEQNELWYVKHKALLRDYLEQYLYIGGYPKVVLTEDELLRKELLIQYFSDILTKDIVDRHRIKEIDKLKNLALFYCTNFTRRYNFNKVKRVIDFPISLDSVHRFSQYMKNAYMINFLPRFSYSLRNQMQSDRKVYFVDNGMHNAVAFKFSEDKGKLLENMVFYHLRHRNKEVFYFHEKKEVDFVIKEGLKIRELINVSYTLSDKQTLLRERDSLKEAMAYFGIKQGKIIVAEGEYQDIDDHGYRIETVPFLQWALVE